MVGIILTNFQKKTIAAGLTGETGPLPYRRLCDLRRLGLDVVRLSFLKAVAPFGCGELALNTRRFNNRSDTDLFLSIHSSFFVYFIPYFYVLYKSKYKILQGILCSMVEIHCVVSGKVQAVAYRTYVQESATTLKINGFVRNLDDGTVEVVAQGSPDLLKEFVEYLNEGSLMSVVAGVAVDWRTVRKTYEEFSLLH